MKTSLRIVLLVAVLLAVALWSSGHLAARLAKSAIEQATGFEVDIGDVQVNLLRPMIRVSNLALRNPPEFPHPEALMVREAGVELAWSSLFSSTVRVHAITLDVPRVVMVRAPGGSNLEALSKGRKEKQPAASQPAPEPDAEGKKEEGAEKKGAVTTRRALVIDELHVRLGEMEVRNYRRSGEEPAVLTIPVNLDRSYTQVTNVEEVAVQLTSELVVLSGVSLFQQLDASLKKLNEQADGTDEKIKNVLNGLQEMFKK